jgi:hypothetical protein
MLAMIIDKGLNNQGSDGLNISEKIRPAWFPFSIFANSKESTLLNTYASS